MWCPRCNGLPEFQTPDKHRWCMLCEPHARSLHSERAGKVHARRAALYRLLGGATIGADTRDANRTFDLARRVAKLTP